MFHLVVENDSVFIVPGIQGLLSPFKALLSWPRIFDCLQRLFQQSLGTRCTVCIWSFCLIQSCVTKCCLNTWLAYCGCWNHCACVLSNHGYLKLTRTGAMKQSEVTHIVMQWPGFFSFTFISLSLFYFPSLFFPSLLLFLLPLPPPSTLSVSLHGGGKMYAGAQVERGRNQ